MRTLPAPARDADEGRGRETRESLRRLLAAAETSPLIPAGAVLLAALFFLRRMAPDVERRPMFVDEVLAALTAINPLPDVLDIVIGDRGGAPLHFVLAHVALGLDSTIESLRWLSVALALATLPVVYDLGRRLGGRVAGVVAAFVVASSSMLEVWGSVGRMYALFAFVGALSADTFVRALQLRTPRAAFVAALAAWLLPAAHPYGIVVLGIEALVALAIWRGRPLRPALPVLAVGLATAPFIIADLRLSERFGVGVDGGGSIAAPDGAVRLVRGAVGGFAGGDGLLFVLFCALALGGFVVLVRQNLAFAVFTALTLAAIPALLVVAQTTREAILVHAHHLIFGLPLWAALIGVAVAYVCKRLPILAVPACALVVGILAGLAPATIVDPRVRVDATAEALAPPADWLRSHSEPGDILVFHSPVAVAALDVTKDATSIPRTGRILEMFRRAEYPASGVVVILPLGQGSVLDEKKLEAKLDSGSEVGLFRYWLVVRREGPIADERAAVGAAIRTLRGIRLATEMPSRALLLELHTIRSLCAALPPLGDRCPSSFRDFSEFRR